MENFELHEDIHLICVKAHSFPEGINDAHNALAAISNQGNNRSRFGVSYLYDDEILYMAAVEVIDDKEEIPGDFETYILKKGNYISIYISDFSSDTAQIGVAFKKLLDNPAIDENGCCAEWYLPEGADFHTAKDIRCMVRLAD